MLKGTPTPCDGPNCVEVFISKRRTQRFCSRVCEKRAARERSGDRIREQERASKARHAEAVAERKRRWYRENAELVKARSSAWYYANREQAAANYHARYERKGEELRAYAVAYRKANPTKCRAWDAKYRSLRKQSGEQIDPVEVFARDGWVCGICTEPIDPERSYPDQRMASLDHVIPLSKDGEHTWSNVQAAHLDCNKRKRARSPV